MKQRHIVTAKEDIVYDDGSNTYLVKIPLEYKIALRKKERDRIIDILKDRQIDLESCLKDDNCHIKAAGIELAIDDIKYYSGEQA